MVLMALAN